MPEHRLFRQCHIDISRAGDLIHPGHAFCSIGQGRHRLGAAYFQDFIRAGLPGRHQRERRQLPILIRRGSHQNLLHSRHLGRDDVHQHAGGIGRLAAGDINPHPPEGPDDLGKTDARLLQRKPFPLLPGMVFLNIPGTLPDDLDKRRVYRFIGRLNFLLRNIEGSLVHVKAVKPLCIGEQSAVAPGFYRRQNLVHSLLLGRAVSLPPFQKALFQFLRVSSA